MRKLVDLSAVSKKKYVVCVTRHNVPANQQVCVERLLRAWNSIMCELLGPEYGGLARELEF